MEHNWLTAFPGSMSTPPDYSRGNNILNSSHPQQQEGYLVALPTDMPFEVPKTDLNFGYSSNPSFLGNSYIFGNSQFNLYHHQAHQLQYPHSFQLFQQQQFHTPSLISAYPSLPIQKNLNDQFNNSSCHSSIPFNTAPATSPIFRSKDPNKSLSCRQEKAEGLNSVSASSYDGHKTFRAVYMSTNSSYSGSSYSSNGKISKDGEKKSVMKRSRMGCLTCRSRKKRCCESRPECYECRRLGFNCVWPVPGSEHKNRNRAARLEESMMDHAEFFKIKVLRGIVEYRITG
ncbi:hypothetical protein BABINDRAFT_161183 [Babjeviella inositovora NRRL Y-12698]|uniref:Zn(2)-C6 fungal-type domain-containing protein n=1 Tax=Babjeviella inositovora NRRL Y-12698 TaxID=984486 RepID=A0A1E3QR85_9ASCO|nr:uncharacterized protein BABINDRAFT_161183 [Babjeviella inositovora NRRL Y-12698]ODQ80213.1 hypothetical protein BABINDRAFT_161183 [Babjeviella inositovora NRRL Y-12698]